MLLIYLQRKIQYAVHSLPSFWGSAELFLCGEETSCTSKTFLDTQPLSFVPVPFPHMPWKWTKTGGFPVQKLKSVFGASNVCHPLPGCAPSPSHSPSQKQLSRFSSPVFQTGHLKLIVYLGLRIVAWGADFICVLSHCGKKMQLLHH